MRVNVRLGRGCLEWVPCISVAIAWVGFGSGPFYMGIIGVLGFLFFSFVGVREFLETAAPAAKRSRSIPQDVKIAVAVRDQGLCQHCGTSAGPMQYDHVIPYSMDGDNSVENIQLLPVVCC